MNKIDLIIRKASKKDVPEMLELVRKYERYDEEYARRYYDKYFARDKAVWEDTVFVAEVEGRVVGFIGYCNDYFSTDYSYWLGWFVVAKEFRGSKEANVARELLQKVESELKKYEVSRLLVSTDDKNGRAINFYVKNGFRFEARLRDYYHEGEDQIILSKWLEWRSDRSVVGPSQTGTGIANL